MLACCAMSPTRVLAKARCTEYELIDSGLKIKSTLIEHILIEDMKFRRNETEGLLSAMV